MAPIKNEVLIVGGGPSGLLLAHELMRRRVPVRIIEKRQGPSHTSRAMTIHARSMEMFEHMGMASRLEEICLECPGNLYHFPGMSDDKCPRTDYRVLPTRFPFYYKISQNDFELALREHLFACYSIGPEYRTELIALEQDKQCVTAKIRHPDGTIEESSYPYVVGCDGVHSFVRKAAGINFEGKTVAVMSMMDVELSDVKFDDRWMNYYFNKDLFMNCTKMPGKYWRIYMSEPTGEYVFAKDAQKAYQEVADKLGIGFKVGKPAWVTAWDVRNHIAERYRTDRMLICGDASHVHSPSGGQGMNGCMQDAFNLGWKLAAVFRGEADEAILNTYERERKPIGSQISKGAMATHEVVMGFGIEPADRLHLTQEPGWEHRTINLVSGLSHNYRDVTLLPEGLTPVTGGPKPGERAPDALLVKEPQRRLYDALRRPQFTLLVAPGTTAPDAVIDIGTQVRDQLNRLFPGQVSTYLISRAHEPRFDFDHQSTDEEDQFTERYGIPAEGRLVLVRPDLYVGMACVPSEWNTVGKYLTQWFLPRGEDAKNGILNN
ncbi:hypothetical protein VTN00DRAFT_2435 [Thermoascus crustaceus]|uniref:uncharacterized protein n=1 Tax=Thermoascus crustaceus TaxID=5088 RepID=UPI00374229DE